MLEDYVSIYDATVIKKLKEEQLITLDRRCVTLFPSQITPSSRQEKRC